MPAELRRRDHARRLDRRSRRGSRREPSRTSPPSCRIWSATSSSSGATSSASTADEPYDVLLDDYEPGMTTAEVRAVFDRLKEVLVAADRGRSASVRSRSTTRSCTAPSRSSASGRSCCRSSSASASTRRAWRLDPTAHPFAIGVGDRRTSGSRRATTRTTLERAVRRDARVRPRALRARRRRPTLERTPLCRVGCRSACTSRRAACGRTSSAAACPFWRALLPASCSGRSPSSSPASSSSRSTGRRTRWSRR